MSVTSWLHPKDRQSRWVPREVLFVYVCPEWQGRAGNLRPSCPPPDSVIGSLFLGTVVGEKGETAGIATGLSWAATELRIRRLLCYAGS